MTTTTTTIMIMMCECVENLIPYLLIISCWQSSFHECRHRQSSFLIYSHHSSLTVNVVVVVYVSHTHVGICSILKLSFNNNVPSRRIYYPASSRPAHWWTSPTRSNRQMDEILSTRTSRDPPLPAVWLMPIQGKAWEWVWKESCKYDELARESFSTFILSSSLRDNMASLVREEPASEAYLPKCDRGKQKTVWNT